MSSLAQVAQVPVASAESVHRPAPGAQPPRDEVEEVADLDDPFPGGPDSAYYFPSKKKVKLAVAVFVKKVRNGHQLDVKKIVERWVQKHTNSSHASPLETTVLKTLLTSLLEEVKVHTKLTQYGTRILLVLTAFENVLENVSDVVNIVDLYFRGQYVFFGLSLGCVVSPLHFCCESLLRCVCTTANPCVYSNVRSVLFQSLHLRPPAPPLTPLFCLYTLFHAGDRSVVFVCLYLSYGPRSLGLRLRVHDELPWHLVVPLSERYRSA